MHAAAACSATVPAFVLLQQNEPLYLVLPTLRRDGRE